MSMRRASLAIVALACVAAVACTAPANAPRSGASPTSVAGVHPSQKGDGPDAQADAVQAEGEQDRIDRVGVAPVTGPTRSEPAPGWAGSVLFGSGNDWEPATAADPGAPYVYILTTRYSGPGQLPCARCDIPAIALKVSSDGGSTFGSVSYLPVDGPGGQYDPQIETDASGDVFAAWIDGDFRIVFSRSSDHGGTWTAPVRVHEGVGWGDHPWLGVSTDGQDVYIAFNHSDSYIAQSHDGGVTWAAPIKLNHQDRYHYANGLVVAPNGNVTITNANYPRNEGYAGPVKILASRSSDGGATWDTTVVDVVEISAPCRNHGCPHNHYGGHAALAGDADGNLVIVYDGSRDEGGAQYIYAARSTDGGGTWTEPEQISPGGREIIATEPAAVGTGDCDIRVIWLDSRSGIERWNTWFRQSTDCGLTWSDDIRLSDAVSGRGYVFARGFAADYGDYSEIAVTSTGSTFAVWGAGFSYHGPGGTWYNRSV
jgi:hypothetical protein